MQKEQGFYVVNLRLDLGQKYFLLRKMKRVYTIRLLPIGGFVRMAGEDPEMVDIKPGYRVGLVLNNDKNVQKIILNNKDKYSKCYCYWKLKMLILNINSLLRVMLRGDEEEVLTIHYTSCPMPYR